jgi:hypothetical protein
VPEKCCLWRCRQHVKMVLLLRLMAAVPGRYCIARCPVYAVENLTPTSLEAPCVVPKERIVPKDGWCAGQVVYHTLCMRQQHVSNEI